MHHSDCLSQATFTFLVCVYQSPVECDPASQFVCADQAKCVDVRVTICAEGSEEKTATLQVRLQVLCCVKLALLSA